MDSDDRSRGDAQTRAPSARSNALTRAQTTLFETFGFSRIVANIAVLLVFLVVVVAVFWFVYSAPPRKLIVTCGPPGTTFHRYAERYAAILAKEGVTLEILSSQGSLENLQRLANPKFKADIGFVQGGVAKDIDTSHLVSLGSVAYEPLGIYYRGASIKLLSQLADRRIAIGAVGSGTHALALTLLQANGIAPGGSTKLVDADSEAAVTALLAGDVDAVFLMGDSASSQTIRRLLQAQDVHLYSFTQADAYTRRFGYLNRVVIPRGSIDFGKDLPGEDICLIGPTVELLARDGLHPALSDLLLSAAQEIHGRAGLLQRQGEFPAPLEHEFAISADATRFYKSGRGVLLRFLHSFWLASLVNRTLVAFVPALLVLIPALRSIPFIYRWRVLLRIYRWYRSLLTLERELAGTITAEQRQRALARLDEIERAVNRLKVPASFADQFYSLRGHIGFVRERLARADPPQ